MPRPIHAEINLAALRSNLAVARRAAPRSKVFAVVKANAYGHGLLRAAGALSNADGFAILEIDYAMRLRDAGYRHPILLLEGVFDNRELALAAEQQFACAIHARDQVKMLAELPAGARVDVFLKLNTGMNRLGLMPAEVPNVLAELRASDRVRAVTLMTHFACADDDRGIASQLQVFEAITNRESLPRSIANSATVLRYPRVRSDWIRPGIMLYGGSPFADVTARSLGLTPVMTLRSRIIAVQMLNTGDAVGYGATYVADSPQRIGIVACGYADGYPRHAQSGTPVVVEGVRTHTVGRVSMDMLCIDITTLPQATVGSPVTLFGDELSADEVASAAGTVSYELFCALASRVPVVERE